MCKKGNSRRIDKCMIQLIKSLNALGIITFASCCGHGRYPPTVVVNHSRDSLGTIHYYNFELFTGRTIPRNSRFYKRDKKGYFYIPEVEGNEKEA
ncbi:MAG: hypothetical protein HY376_03295 [Candidatus Blackburnbacteria bacterium]|nr:hypothetical protein [Candidatus Blackburnbacteria bacterium]